MTKLQKAIWLTAKSYGASDAEARASAELNDRDFCLAKRLKLPIRGKGIESHCQSTRVMEFD